MAPTVYRRRHPEKTVLYQVIREHYLSFLAVCEQEERPLPRFVRREFEGFLDCGILARGFLRVRCRDCGYDRLVGYSCKRRGFCGACVGRRMSEAAAHLVENVLPAVPLRHWVLSLPPPLRYLLAYDRSLCSEVLRIYQRKLFAWLRRRAREELGLASVGEAHPGAITVIQRASSHLALNVHFHSLVTDGVFVEVEEGVEFRKLPPPSDEEVGEIAWGVCHATMKLLSKRGLWSEDTEPEEDRLLQTEPGLARLYQASVRGVLALGPRAGQRVVRFFGAASGDQTPKLRSTYGFDLHARQRIQGEDREGVERMCRYLLRPPLARKRLKVLPDGRVQLGLKRAWSDGTRAICFEPLDFLGKLAALVPIPRMHTIRFQGVFSAHARLRPEVVPKGKGDSTACEHDQEGTGLSSGLECPRCESRMQAIAAITDPTVIRKILRAVGMPTDSPELSPARREERTLFPAA
jgi:hypothetical protein